MYQDRYNNYDRWKKFFLVIVGILGLIVSYSFSVDGFGIDVQGKRWAGWVMGFLITGFQLVLNAKNDGKNLSVTLVILGLIAYSYGIWTNVNGILLSQGDGLTILSAIKTSNYGSLILPGSIGFLLEVGPEPLIAYAVFGNAALIDVFGNLGIFFSGHSGRPHRPSTLSSARGASTSTRSSSSQRPVQQAPRYAVPSEALSLGGNARRTSPTDFLTYTNQIENSED